MPNLTGESYSLLNQAPDYNGKPVEAVYGHLEIHKKGDGSL